MSSVLPEKLLKQRYKLQLVSLESPSELPDSRSVLGCGVSPMTDLANNLNDTSLGLTPVQDSKRRLSMDSESSDSTPSPREKLNFCVETPLTSLVNKPKRLLQTSSRLSFSLLVDDEDGENKENIPRRTNISPKKKLSILGSPQTKTLSSRSPCKTKSPGKGLFCRRVSPLKDRDLNISPLKKVATKRSMWHVFDEEDMSSRDSGYDSQNLDEPVAKIDKPTPCPGSMAEILHNCSPDKEDGIAPLKSSPDREMEGGGCDGFDLHSLETIDEDQENQSPSFDLNSLLSKKILLPEKLRETDICSEDIPHFPMPLKRASSFGKRPGNFRRALSMLDQPTGSDFCSPVSRNSDISLSERFKRPDPPRNDEPETSSKRRKINVATLPEFSKPKFFRSHSENELSVMKSCQLKEEVDNILPDSSRLYALPCMTGDVKHPSLPNITCHVLSDLMQGKYHRTINSVRIIDVRYSFEFSGGHIKGAENWQHGEDEQFISAFLPPNPLPRVPDHDPHSSVKRDILIFHCEFSSQRGPDFYNKLRARDRTLNQHVYPALHHPEMYLLHLGYKEFFKHFPHLCEGTYTEMIDPKHESDLRKMRAKSKSWSGGTIMRTGRMSRLHL